MLALEKSSVPGDTLLMVGVTAALYANVQPDGPSAATQLDGTLLTTTSAVPATGTARRMTSPVIGAIKKLEVPFCSVVTDLRSNWWE
jgi:hypothetical protein